VKITVAKSAAKAKLKHGDVAPGRLGQVPGVDADHDDPGRDDRRDDDRRDDDDRRHRRPRRRSGHPEG